MITILFFAQIREIIGVKKLEIDVDKIIIQDLIEQLSEKGSKWSLALKENTVLCSVNQKLVDYQHTIYAGDEIAFFPPVTGG